MVRQYEDKDYPMLCKWWKDWNWPNIPKMVLPEMGFIANECAAVFLYDSGTAIAWIEWLVSDKEADKDLRAESINEVLKYAEMVAKNTYRAKCIHISIRNQVLEKKLLNLGYEVSDRHMVNMMKILGE